MFVKPGLRQEDRDLRAGEARDPRQLVVRMPDGRFLSALGGEVPDTQFWHRRVRDGDVVAAEPVLLETGVRHIAADGTVTDQSDASVKIGELIADGQVHTAAFAGDHPAEPALTHDGEDVT